MKYIIFTISCFSALFLNAQNFAVKTKITKDSIAIKWLPSNFEELKDILEGAKVYRAESKETDTPSLLNFELIKDIPSTKERYLELYKKELENDKFITLLSLFYEGLQEKEEENFIFGTNVIENVINPDFQFIVGNIFVDKKFSQGSSYYYKIEITKKPAIYVFIDTKKRTQYPGVMGFELLLDLKKTVELSWDYQSIKNATFGFIIEHSIDDTIHVENLLNEPYLPFTSSFEKEGKKPTVRDDNPLGGHFHYYRINGLDEFGLQTIHSKWNKIYVPLLIDAWVQIDTVYAKQEDRFILGHVFEDKKSNILSVSLLRSSSKDSNYVVIESREFIDSISIFQVKTKLSDDHYYYKFIAYNLDDTVSSLPYYFFTLDQEPPKPPTDIKGIVDSLGIVTLTWNAPPDNDLQGYRVFRANAKDEDFVEKTKKLSLTLNFIDTIRLDNLTSDIYYYVKAVDNNYNNSFSSDTVLLIKPDTIPPVSAIIIDVKVKDSIFIISWTNSTSEDLKHSKLIKYSAGKADTIFTWNDSTSSYIDKIIIPGSEYSYAIKTFDKSLNNSETKKLLRFYEPGFRNPLQGVKATIDSKEKGVQLVWSKPSDQVYDYIIYKAKAGEKLLPLKTINGKEPTQFLDKQVNLNNKYSYSIKYMNESGIHSKPVVLEIVYQ